MFKVLINTTASPVFIADTGIEIAASSSYTIVPQDYWIWTSSADTVSLIVAGTLIVNDGESNLPQRIAIGLIQDNQILINEYYTLVQDGDILIGDGQILYLNDTFPTTNNVPDYPDVQIEDDVPTQGDC